MDTQTLRCATRLRPTNPGVKRQKGVAVVFNNQKQCWKIRRKGRKLQKLLPRQYANIFISHKWDLHESEYLWLLKETQASSAYYFYDKSVPYDIKIRANEKEVKNKIKKRIQSSKVFILLYEQDMVLTKWMKYEIHIAQQINIKRVVVYPYNHRTVILQPPIEYDLELICGVDDPSTMLSALISGQRDY
ncbi:MAG: TIR domain-containing protein [Candidatus Thiodiazotropha taylori]